MKKILKIRQEAILSLAPTITLTDAVVLDYIYWLCVSSSKYVQEKRIEHKGRVYTWVSYPHLLEQIPLLKGRTVATLTPVFKHLESFGFIKTARWQATGRKYVCLEEVTLFLYKKQEDGNR